MNESHLTDLAELVRDMRSAQKRYFKTRDRSDLESSKIIELTVDAEVKAILRPATLFDKDTA